MLDGSRNSVRDQIYSRFNNYAWGTALEHNVWRQVWNDLSENIMNVIRYEVYDNIQFDIETYSFKK